jgi:benzoyl-CoA reductase/2-hydroxyglutaryl-CoA dehydratase subunit BcrC/BadD/HgdB
MGIRACARNSPAFSELLEYYGNRELALQQWRRRGGKIVGQLGADVPDELLIAAGMLPVRIYADSRRALTETDKYLEYAFDPVVRAQFEKLADGTYKSLIDYLAISNSTDVLTRVFVYLREILRTEPEAPVPPVTFIDWLFTGKSLYRERNVQTLRLFGRQLEAWAGRRISDEDIRQAVMICNEDREAMRALAALRHGKEVRIGGSEALVVIGSGFFMDRAEHARLVKSVAAEAREWPVIGGPRIYMTGSAQESTALYDIIEDAGGVVVGEDHDWGDRSCDGATRTDIPPLEALVDRYMLRLFSSKKALVSRRVEALIGEAVSKGAEAVLFYMNVYDEAASWDYPSQKQALDRLGIATAAYFKMPYPISDKAALQESITTFVDSLRGGVKRVD